MASTANRTRRSSIERRCLSKSSKRLFRNAPRALRRVVYEAECQLKGRKPL